MSIRLHFTIASLATLALALVAGCSCAAPTLGLPCTNDRDCRAPEICNLATNTCDYPPGFDAGPIDTGPLPDAPGADVPMAMTDTPGCPDADMDGVTTCAGDCDDVDPNTYPGATEVCGDGVTNDCSSNPPDMGCGGIGTYVSQTVGVDTNPGTQAMPVRTIARGIMNAMTIGGGVDVYVANGTYDEDVTMVEGVSIYGGYEPAGWTRDTTANVTIINAATATGVLIDHVITRATALDGVTVNGRSGVASSAAITVMGLAAPEINDCIVNGGDTSGSSHAIHINPTDLASMAQPWIHDTDVNCGGSGAGWGGGNGSWGIRSRLTATVIEDVNVMLVNDDAVVRGIELVRPPAPGATVSRTTVTGVGRSTVGFGIRLGGGNATIDSSRVFLARCQDYCVGIAAEGPIGRAVITNNVSFGGEGAVTQIGLSVAFEALPPAVPDILVHSNFFDGGLATTGASHGVWMGERPSAPFIVGRFFDNVIRSGLGTNRYAFWENHPNIDPQAFQNNALFVARMGAGTSALYHDEGATDLNMIAAINALPASGMNLADDCSVVSPMPMGDYHLGAGSMCIDAGTSTEAPSADFEGDARPGGAAPDIGPDET
jgi:hypothetical protein